MDEDDAFLYGDSEATTETPAAPQPDLNAGSTAAVAPAGDSGEDMDEATDESDVEIILDADPAAPAPQPNRQGPHRTWGGGAPQINVAQLQQQIQDQQSQLQQEATFPLLPPSNAQALRTLPPNQAPGPNPNYADPSNPPDLSTPALVDDQTSLLDVDLDSLESKPWTLPGAHVADYFNYGFDEASWRLYVAQQKQSREESAKMKENPFAGFAKVSVQEAWNSLPPELKGVMMQTIMSSFGGGAGMMPGMMPGMGMPGMDMSQMGMDMSGMGGGEGYDEEGYGAQGYDASGGFGDYDQNFQGGFRGGRGGKRAGGKGANPFGLGAGGVVVPKASSSSVPTGPRAVSPLPANIPTGPRKAGGPPPEGPRASRGKGSSQYYRDKDASGSAQNGDGLDYGDQPDDSSRGGSKRSGRRSRGSRRKDYSDESEDEFQRRRRSRSYSAERSRSRSASPGHSKRRADDDSSKSSRSKRSRKTYE